MAWEEGGDRQSRGQRAGEQPTFAPGCDFLLFQPVFSKGRSRFGGHAGNKMGVVGEEGADPDEIS